MDDNLPPHLQATRNLLAASLHLHPTDEAPPVPNDLLDDLARRFSPTPETATPRPSRSYFAAIQSFIARPAFGMAALAVVILTLAVPAILKPNRASAIFRGTATTTPVSQNIRIILVKAPPAVRPLLEKSGDFEASVISTVEQIESAGTGARIVVDYQTSTISALNAAGVVIYSAPLPADFADLSSAIATAVSRL